ncbi:hypothetical protein L2735_04505 [Shewanella olleyana]|uniref:hypothetical protein n=1 Tax=Shewanella olleyana TaxID=135626 RepID=UPI00200F6845|nr:hypothetical protein [Shewanella olleyana]MCL1066068.1 hypothetical protein [Shewanella olleyana]
MYFKQLTQTKAIMAKARSAVITRGIVISFFALMSLFLAFGLEHWNYGELLNWALANLLIWHLMFAKRQVTFDLETKQIITKITSLYTLAEQVILINQIAAIEFRQTIARGNGYGLSYDLIFVLKGLVTPIKFENGNLQPMTLLGEQISKFCNVPMIKHD